MLLSGCDDRECRVLLHKGVRIGERPHIFLENPDGAAPPPFHPDVLHLEFCSVAIPPGCITSGILFRRHSTRMSHIRHTPSPDISHLTHDARWERRAFQLLRSDTSGSSDNAYPESFAAILHSAAVFSWSFQIFATDILGYFEIFCFRYLLSKSPKSPCNPPIIGFLSY